MAEYQSSSHEDRLKVGIATWSQAVERGEKPDLNAFLEQYADIAEELSLSVKTVSTYRNRILKKMNFSSNAEMTSYALRSGLIQ